VLEPGLSEKVDLRIEDDIPPVMAARAQSKQVFGDGETQISNLCLLFHVHPLPKARVSAR